MKSTGITRPVDELGRVVLPKELRDSMDIQEKDRLEVFTDGDCIILRKYERGCVFCGDITTMTFKGKRICQKCRAELRRTT